MAQVTLRINGYAYTLGCRDGEEAHLNAMAREVEKRIESVRSMAGQSGESRMLLMAALTMADELYEVEQRLQSGRSGGEARMAKRLSRMATRAEEIAAGLEAP
jgi:cell division protein ZapA